MKCNWLTHVSIVVALLAGMVSSPAFADGKMGGKFQSSSFQGSSGGNRRSLNMPSQGLSSQQFQGLGGLGGGNSPVKKPQIQLNQGASNAIGGAVLGNSNKPKIQVNPGVSNAINGTVLGNSNKPTIHVDPAISNAINGAVLGNKPQIKPGPGVSQGINNAVLGKYCVPICPPKPCDPCYNPCNHWCGTCWWWSPIWDPCFHSCYFPTYYCYPEPIYVTIPVATTVVTGAVKPAVAVQEKLLQIPVGATITLQGKDLGDKAGMLVVQIDKISLPAQVNEWKPDSANVTLPMLGLAGPTKAQLWMVKADGAVASNMAVELLPAQQPAAGAVLPK